MPSYRFNDYELIPDTRRLLHAGVDVAIGVRVFEFVAYLVQNRQRAVGRDELLSAVWGRVDGGDATLAQAVLKARRALGDDGETQNCIRTVSRFGYQWVAPTVELASETSAAFAAPQSDSRDASSIEVPRAEDSLAHADSADERIPQASSSFANLRNPWVAALAAATIVAVVVLFASKQQRVPAAPEPASSLIGRIEGADRRQCTGILLALDDCHLAAAALRQPRGADVPGQYVRIAVDAERQLRRTMLRIIPGTRG